MSSNQTNVEFITELMEYSKCGGLQQMFVIASIEVYATQIRNCTREEWEKTSMSGMISFEAWQGCADEVLTKLDDR